MGGCGAFGAVHNYNTWISVITIIELCINYTIINFCNLKCNRPFRVLIFRYTCLWLIINGIVVWFPIKFIILHTIYIVYLAVILIWQFGNFFLSTKFSFIGIIISIAATQLLPN